MDAVDKLQTEIYTKIHADALVRKLLQIINIQHKALQAIFSPWSQGEDDADLAEKALKETIRIARGILG